MQKFTIKTKSDTGLGDQLVTQFQRLYVLGNLLGYEYVYTELKFPRSSLPFVAHHIHILAYFIRVKLFFLGQNRFTFICNKILSKIEIMALKWEIYSKPSQEIASFLGFLYKKKENVVYCDISIDTDLLEKNPSVKQLNRFLTQKLVKNKNVIRFVWEDNSYQSIKAIDQFISLNTTKPIKELQYNFSNQFSENKYYNSRLIQFESNKEVKIVIHIRLGDSTSIQLGTKKILLHDDYILSDNEFNNILTIDPNRKFLSLDNYKSVLEEISPLLTLKSNQIFIISDGFEKTAKILIKKYLNKNIILDKSQRESLSKLIQKPNHAILELQEINNSIQFVIGENKMNLFSSLQLLHEANVVFFGTGGFAYGMHELLRTSSSTFLCHLSEFKDRKNDFLTFIEKV